MPKSSMAFKRKIFSKSILNQNLDNVRNKGDSKNYFQKKGCKTPAGVATGANRALHHPPCPCHTPPNNSPPRQHTPQTPPRHATSSGHMPGVTSDRQRGTAHRSGGRNRRQQGPPPPSLPLPLPHPSQQLTAPPTHPADTATTRHEQRAHVWSHL
jgi:hypothetical protein